MAELQDMDSLPRRKRQKVFVACGPCRSRKVKCDGISPVCGQCTKPHRTTIRCTWDAEYDGVGHDQQNPTSTTPGTVHEREYELSARVRYLEQCLAVKTAPESHQITPATTIEPASSLHEPGVRTSRTAMSGRETNDFQPLERSSSAGSFIQHIRRIAERRTAGDHLETVLPGAEISGPRLVPSSSKATPPGDYLLPPRTRADRLFTTYWSELHTIYPILDQELTSAAYESLWQSDNDLEYDNASSHKRSFHCLLNVMFAIASQLDSTHGPQERVSSAAAFYTRASDLVDLQNTACLRYVQIYLLFAIYLQSTDEPHNCWLFTGLATRTAQSLELHLPHTSERALASRDKALLRRVWHGCVLLDRDVSMMYGRPCAIGPETGIAVPLSQAIEGEQTAANPTVADGPREQSTHLIDSFNQTLKLYDVLHATMIAFYSSSTSRHQLLVLDHKEDKVPFHPLASLRSTTDLGYMETAKEALCPTGEHPFYTKGFLRYLQVRLLSLRPIFSAFIATNSRKMDRVSGTDLPRRLAFECSLVCVELAQEAIELALQSKPESSGFAATNAPWWCNVLFLYTSATVLMSTRLAPSIHNKISEQAIETSWRKALDGLKSYSAFGEPIKRLIVTLDLLSDKIPPERQAHSGRQHEHPATAASRTGQDYGSVQEVEREVGNPSSPPSHIFDNAVDPSNDTFATLDDSMDLLANLDTNDMSWLTTVPFDMSVF